jgi:hypothetical protein
MPTIQTHSGEKEDPCTGSEVLRSVESLGLQVVEYFRI